MRAHPMDAVRKRSMGRPLPRVGDSPDPSTFVGPLQPGAAPTGFVGPIQPGADSTGFIGPVLPQVTAVQVLSPSVILRAIDLLKQHWKPIAIGAGIVLGASVLLKKGRRR